MLRLVSDNPHRPAFHTRHTPLPAAPDEIWVVSMTGEGVHVFVLADRHAGGHEDPSPCHPRFRPSWRLEPELGMQVDLAPSRTGPDPLAEVHLAQLVAGTLCLARENLRFRYLVLVASANGRRHLRRFLDEATRHAIIAEADLPEGLDMSAMERCVARAVGERR